METKLNYHDAVMRTVMVVDDEEVNRQMLGGILEENYHVIFASDGSEALSLARENANILSAVMLDLFMPNVDGFEVLREMKADKALKRIPIIVLTSDKNAEVQSLKFGAADFIPKPYDMPEIILARLERIIELSEDRLIIQAAERDEFTGLFSASFFYEYAAMTGRYHPDRAMDALVLDIDHFHLVNELYGRSFGDKVLLTVAESLKKIASEREGIAARKEGDIFMLYLPQQGDYKGIKQVFDSHMKSIFKNARIRIRIGVCPPNEKEDSTIEGQFEQARFACNTIRDRYNLSIAYYDAELNKKTLFSERLIHDIDDGIKKRQFKVYFQPKYGIQGGEPVLKSAEALVRWEHPEFGLVSPGLFIPLFEENGLIQKVDEFVWREAASYIRRWKDLYNVTLPISVNVSRIDIHNSQVEDTILGIVNEFNLEPKDLHLEITESGYSEDSNRLVEVVKRFREKGFIIEMDDFGSGYSSLNMLSTLPIDVLKMDMKFVRDMQKDKKNFRMIKMIIDIADYLSVPVVAEGVEDEEQYRLLKDAGCEMIQGYYFSKPLPAEEFEGFVKALAG